MWNQKAAPSRIQNNKFMFIPLVGFPGKLAGSRQPIPTGTDSLVHVMEHSVKTIHNNSWGIYYLFIGMPEHESHEMANEGHVRAVPMRFGINLLHACF